VVTEQDIKELKENINFLVKAASNSYPRWMDIKLACLYSSMSKNTLMEYIMRGNIYAKKLAGKWYVDRMSLDSFMLKDGAELDARVLKLCK